MQDDLTHITVLLDRTGSMESIADDTVGGLNQFIREQQDADGNATLTLIQFDSRDPQEVVHDALPIGDVPKMRREDFRPRAMTPLLDAIGMAIVGAGERLASIREADRPAKVVFVTITDGLENASREYSLKAIRDMIERQERVYSWRFVFLGAGIDAVAEGAAMGMAGDSTVSVARETLGEAIAMSSQKLSRYRVTGECEDLGYTDEERKKLGG